MIVSSFSAGLGVASSCAIYVSASALTAPLAISYVAMHAFKGCTANKTLRSNIALFTLLAGVTAVVFFLGMSVLLPTGISLATQSLARACSSVLWKSLNDSKTGKRIEFEGTLKDGKLWNGQQTLREPNRTGLFDVAIWG